jgi:hypothetical protein
MTPNSIEERRKIYNFMSCGPDPSPDLGSVPTALQKPCIGSKFGPQTFDFTSQLRAGVGDHLRSHSGAVWNSCLGSRGGAGRGHHDGGTKIDTRPAAWTPVYNRSMIENPLSLALLGGETSDSVAWVSPNRTSSTPPVHRRHANNK